MSQNDLNPPPPKCPSQIFKPNATNDYHDSR